MIRVNKELLEYVDKLQRKEGEQVFEEHSFKPREKIIEQDRRIPYVYVLKKGVTKCYQTEEGGRDFIQEFHGEGQLFGEVEVILNSGPSVCFIEAINQVETYRINAERFRQLVKEDPEFNTLILRTLSTKISYKPPRHTYQHYHTVEDNILRLRQQFPQLTEIISKQDIANYLGITLRSYNRAIKNLESSGINP
jgi:CRP-like cAMP-binding protein